MEEVGRGIVGGLDWKERYELEQRRDNYEAGGGGGSTKPTLV